MNSIDVVSVPGNSVDPEAWDEVLQAVSPEHRFLSHHWYDTWSRTYAANDEDMQPVVYSSTVATDDVAARASLFPCVLRHRAGIQVLSMAGYYYPFRTFLCPPDVKDAAINGFVDAIHDESKVAVVLVGPLQTDDPVCDALQNAFRRRRWRLCGVDAGAQQVVQLPDSVEAFRASLSRNLRKNHDRRLRSLESAGEFEISYYNDCSADRWAHAISASAEVESRSWLALDDDDAQGTIPGRACDRSGADPAGDGFLSLRQRVNRGELGFVGLRSPAVANGCGRDRGGGSGLAGSRAIVCPWGGD